VKPVPHVAHFAGEYPCDANGEPQNKIALNHDRQELVAGVFKDHSFSARPQPEGHYRDYHHKMTTYLAMITEPARQIDPKATAQTRPIFEPDEDEESVFRYVDTASSRADIDVITDKLKPVAIAIVGLGGTGAYVLDLVAKTPVREIHIFDGDEFSQHNAFRCPGVATIEELGAKPSKVAHLTQRYSPLHKRIVAHPYYVDETNVDQLRAADFVFICVDRGDTRKLVVEKLEELGRPFIDVGMGLYKVKDVPMLGGIVRSTASIPGQPIQSRAKRGISFSAPDGENEYSRNIQVADLNALNAALAVIKWKKLAGFYSDLEHEHDSTYTIDGNTLANEDQV
jgi:hypothetical protein